MSYVSLLRLHPSDYGALQEWADEYFDYCVIEYKTSFDFPFPSDPRRTPIRINILDDDLIILFRLRFNA